MTGLSFPKPRRPKPIWLITVVILLVVLAATVWWALQPRAPQAEQKLVPPTAPTYASLQSHLLFAGDIYWGRYMNQWAQASGLGEAYPFSRLGEFDRSAYDAWIGNLECPMVSSAHPTPEAEEKTLTFNCPPAYAPEFAKWFTVVSQANNHSDNQKGKVGLDETRTHLDEVGMQYFGHYDPRKLSEVCEIIALPVRITMSDKTETKARLPFAMCGYHGVFRVPQADSLAVMQQYAKYMPVISYPHMGTEYLATADSLRQNLYRKMIDNGADIVFGNHPHWVQPSEAYKGHPIFYSMGNFIFDQQLKPETTRSAAIDITMSLAEGAASSDELQAWTALGETCAKFQDDCLAQAEKQQLRRLPLTFSLSIVGVDTSGKITHRADKTVTDAITQRLQWPQTIGGLQAPFSGK